MQMRTTHATRKHAATATAAATQRERRAEAA